MVVCDGLSCVVPMVHGEVMVFLGFLSDRFKLHNIYLLPGILGFITTDKVVDHKVA